jgi:hypothetical protein
MRMFLPFGAGRTDPMPARTPDADAAPRSEGDLDALKRQLEEVQKRLDKLSEKE